jgi:DNA-binding protein YbaB
MTEQELSIEQRTAQALADADKAMATLKARVEGVKQAQQQALHATGEATSKDGSVHVVVDSTGVVTSLRFAPAALERTTPERLAQIVVATIQTAAAQARGRMSAALAPVRDNDDGLAKVITDGLASLGVQRAVVPDVPRTAQDISGGPGPQEPPSRPAWGAIEQDRPAPEPVRVHPTSNRLRPADTSARDADDWSADERPW